MNGCRKHTVKPGPVGVHGLESETDKDPKSRHYDSGGIETLDVIKAKLTPEQYRGFLLGNIIKYSCRLNFKGQETRDTEKIGFYQKFLKEVTK